MKKSIGILNNVKIVKKNFMPVSIKFGIRGLSALSTEALSATAIKFITAKKPGKLSQIVDPALALIGLAGEVFLQNQYLSAFAQGMSSESIRSIGHTYIPASIKSKMNLSGLSRSLNDKKTTQDQVSEANNEMIKQEIESRKSSSAKSSDLN